MASTDASDINRVAKTKRQYTAACERCRGQKLRCLRTPKGCERCEKTGAKCVVDPNVRMGRPQRGERGRERPEKTTSPPEPQSISQSSLMTTIEWESGPNSMWLMDETQDLGQGQGQDLFDLGLHNPMLDNDHMHSTSASASDDWYDSSDFDQVFSQAPSTAATSDSIKPSPFISVDPPTLTMGSEKRNAERISAFNATYTAPHGLIERLTSLNLSIHQQSLIAGQITRDYGDVDSGLMGTPQKDDRLSSAVESMIQGLQTFQDILLEINDTTKDGSLSGESIKHVSTKSQKVPRFSSQQPAPSRFIAAPSRSCLTNLFWSRETGTNNQQTRSSITTVDIPTSLIIISCHINLICLCRHVFVGIRGAFFSRSHHDGALLVLSSCQIGGVSISQDSDLRLLILIQVVARLINKIGVLLGYPCASDSTATSQSSNGLEEKDDVLLPQLLQFVLAQKGMAGQLSYGEEMDALREEIRRLNEALAAS